jgi:hypothetical protein
VPFSYCLQELSECRPTINVKWPNAKISAEVRFPADDQRFVNVEYEQAAGADFQIAPNMLTA